MKQRTSTPGIAAAVAAPMLRGRWRRLLASDLWHDFTHSPVAMMAAAIALL